MGNYLPRFFYVGNNWANVGKQEGDSLLECGVSM